MRAEVRSPLSAAEQQDGHAQDHEEREQEGGLEGGGGGIGGVPLREGRGLELM